jgi:hypothetical protein
MRVHKEVLKIKGRDIIKVTVDNKFVQPFYRSTGRNSKKPNEWLPFDGVMAYGEIPIWMDKDKYANKENPELNRYGTEQLKEISKKLGQLDIPQGTEALPSEINIWLGYENFSPPIDNASK